MIMMMRTFLRILLLFFSMATRSSGFYNIMMIPSSPQKTTILVSRHLPVPLLDSCHFMTSSSSSQPEEEEEESSTSSTSSVGDPLRAATGIRPSLHPTTINAIAEALKARATKKEGMAFRISDTVQPLEVALTAGKIASNAIANRQKSSEKDDMKLLPKEEQTVAGRVLGVIMRLDELERLLQEKVSTVSWISKYNEWATFGVTNNDDIGNGNDDDAVDDRIRHDPLFAVSRAECLLAIFLDTVEMPLLLKAKESVPDGSKIDFLDEDRREVLVTTVLNEE